MARVLLGTLAGVGVVSVRDGILIVTLPWPPMGGVGVRRKAKMAKYIDRAGVPVHVITARNSSAAHTYDADVAAPGIEVTYAGGGGFYDYMRRDLRSLPAKAVRRLVSTVAAPLYPVDHAQRWSRSVMPRVRGHLERSSVSVVYCSGMPFSTLAEMAALKRELGDRMFLVAEWRDWWTEFPGRHYPWPAARSRALNERLEAEVLAVADLIVAVTPSMRATLAARSDHPDRCVCLPNGYDPDDVASDGDAAAASSAPDMRQGGPVRIAYTGDLGPTRIEAMTRVLDAVRELGADAVHIDLMGPIGGQEGRLASEYGDLIAAGALVLHGKRSPAEAMRLVAQADYGVVAVQREHPEALPSKFFDYVGAGRTLLCVGPSDGELAARVSERDLGLYVTYDDPDAVDALVRYVRSGQRASVSGMASAREEYALPRIAEEFLRMLPGGDAS